MDSIQDTVIKLIKRLAEKYIDKKEPIVITHPKPSYNEIKEDIFSDNPSSTCIICTRRKRHTIIVPCFHSIMCTVCSKEYLHKNAGNKHILCPICKNPIEKIKRIYL